MKRVFLLVASFFLVVMAVQAHVVLTDGTIGVTMHVNPNDAPVAASPSQFIFWFKDTSGRLDQAQVKGTFTLLDSDAHVLTSQPLFAPTDSDLTAFHDFTFSKPGVYTVRVNGEPKGTAAFQPFHFEFTVRVTGSVTPLPHNAFSWVIDHAPHLFLGLLGGALILWFGWRSPSKKVNKKKP